LKAATGEYLFFLADDDLISNDYVEKMVALFQGNPECTSAAGLPERIDASGRLLEAARIANFRPRYMPGHLLALSTLNGEVPDMDILMFSTSNNIWTIKREALVKEGGFPLSFELGNLYGIVPFGVTGFDETAIIYFRRWEGQMNKQELAQGYIGFQETLRLLKDWRIQQRWQVFGKDAARYVVRRIKEINCRSASGWFVFSLYNFRFKASLKILTDAGGSFYFWRKLPGLLWSERRQFWWYLRPKIRRIFQDHPWLTQKFPFLTPLKNKAFKYAPPGSYTQ
jgi:hypothetical protein